MIRKVLRQNRVFVLASITLLVVWSSSLLAGERLIYTNEEERQHAVETAQLLSSEERITGFFSGVENDLLFLSHVLSINDTTGDLKSNTYKDEAAQVLRHLLIVKKQYSSVRILSPAGYEAVRVDDWGDGSPAIVPESDLKDRSGDDYFQEVLKPGPGGILASPVTLEPIHGKDSGVRSPLLTITMPLFDSGGEKIGLLAASIYFKACLELLPEHIFVQTPEGNLMSLAPDGSVSFYLSNYDFVEPEGLLQVSAAESIHYSSVEALPGLKLVVAMHHEYPALAQELRTLIIVAAVLMFVFLSLMAVISYVNISRASRLIRAERAIISSLASLAEGRDPETGRHLERARQYSWVLARELKKSRKYRKTLSDDFIQDLYDTAPLHDIGKVGIPDSILLKQAKLTEEEYEEVKKHVVIGAEVVEKAMKQFKLQQPFLIMGRNICAYHHEKYNGRGYLAQLKGQQIPLEAMIFALSDAYDVIRSARPYKAELSHEEAVLRIKSERGEHFAPDVVDAFMRCESEFARIAKTYA